MQSESADSPSTKRPVRTCVVCRKTADKSELVRFAVLRDEHRLVLDLAERLPGRGAYCHCAAGCLFDRKLGEKLSYSITRRKSVRGGRSGKEQPSTVLRKSKEIQNEVDAAELIRRELGERQNSTKLISGARSQAERKLDRLEAILPAGEREPQRRKHRVFF